ILIPPSVPIMIFAFITEQSVGRLLIAGVFPGLLSAAIYMVSIYIRASRSPELAPRPLVGVSWKERIGALKNIWAMVLLIVVIIGGLFAGVWTPSEAAGGGAFVSLLIGVVMLRRLGPRQIWLSLWSAVQTTSMIFMLLVAAGLFSHFLVDARLAEAIISFLGSLPVPPIVVLLMILAFYIFIGTFFSVFETLIVTLPIVFPVIVALGFDPIWFTILMVKTMEMGAITPPFGLNVFIIKGVVPEVPLWDIFRGIWPFLLMDVLTLAILVAFPFITTFLPSIMRY
ncbi:MAG: TRAP transporter large permease, partial [Dehalococcoidia bacterium]